MTRALFLALSALVLCGCHHRSEDEIKAEYDAFVAARNACNVDTDCVYAGGGCPLGCGSAVNAAFKAEVDSKAKELIDEYQESGEACSYSCVATELKCNASRCAAVPKY